jgi:hypothetical protein
LTVKLNVWYPTRVSNEPREILSHLSKIHSMKVPSGGWR